MTQCPGCMGSGRVAERDRWFVYCGRLARLSRAYGWCALCAGSGLAEIGGAG